MLDLLTLPFRRFFDFSGRSARLEFWIFALFSVVLSLFAGLVDDILGHHGVMASGRYGHNGPVALVISAVLLLPTLAVTVRRLHDTDRSGWWILLSLVPILGWIVLLVYYCLGGTPGDNAYGDDPRDAFY